MVEEVVEQHQAEEEEEIPPNFDDALRLGLLRDRRRNQEMQFDRAAEIVGHALGFHPAFLDRPVDHPMPPDPDGPVVANMAFVGVAAAANYPQHEANEPPPRVTDFESSSSEESESDMVDNRFDNRHARAKRVQNQFYRAQPASGL